MMRLHAHAHIEIPGGGTALTGLAHPFYLDKLVVFNAGQKLYLHFALRLDAAHTPACGARFLRDLARAMEPRASTPELRLKAIAGLKAAGVRVGVSVAPIIPVLTDPEIERIIERAAEAGAESVNFTLLRLPLEIKDLFGEWLEAHAPLKAKHVLDLVKEVHGGVIYRAEFHERMTGSGPYAELIRQRVLNAARKFGLDRYRWDVDYSQFKLPPKATPQGDLFA